MLSLLLNDKIIGEGLVNMKNLKYLKWMCNNKIRNKLKKLVKLNIKIIN